MAMRLLVKPGKNSGATLDWGAGARRCAVGRGGIGIKHGEGDGITPVGTFPIRRLLYRADRISRPASQLPMTQIQEWDGWCDMPGDAAYNKPVRLPYPARAEHLWRADHLYDLVAVIGFNDDPVIDGAGSAIFLHVAREDYGPTEGCVALALADLLAAVKKLHEGAIISIIAP